MSQTPPHATHPAIVRRLRRAEGHLRGVVDMIGAERPCVEIAIQLQAVERAVRSARQTLIRDHLDHCLGKGDAQDLADLKALARLL